ncbi:hypothetical protein [Segniliparus rugosus]|uniref:Uncharacterized protein n=1 Tax=Segniliparus rugosus (strain ATCC BAA-974 / DSM 45345 / CCUG 50838 / CIP 108380 / JCM 13579 / CDC 945) TaxID=679197 RepID=E5XKZ9_SEGRC|nr:hypothetical protein [Segniliparus rugosus]EFV14981.1 hypothetical protein HMPREF9336_00168 [Segniliparus rugosus ATCC BAA-974]
MNLSGPDTSSKRRSAAALLALAAAAGFWSSPAAAADPHSPAPAKPGTSPLLQDTDPEDDATDDQPSDDEHRNIRNPYVSGPLAGIGGPTTNDNKQDIGQTIDDVLGDVTQGRADGVGETVNGILDGVAQGGGGDGIGQAVDGVLGRVTQGEGGDGIREAIGGVLGKVAKDGEDGQIPEPVRKGVIRLNKALGDTGFNSDDDSHGAGPAGKSPAAPDDDN